VGQFFVTIKIFFEHQFAVLAGVFTGDDKWKDFFAGTARGLTFGTIFSFAYVILVLWTIVISLATPIDRAMHYFRIITAIFSALTLLSLIGIGMTLLNTGWWQVRQD